MKLLVFLFLLLGYSPVCLAQEQPVNESASFSLLRRYVTNVRLVGQSKPETGVLFNVTDSTVVLIPVDQVKSLLRMVANQQGGTSPSIDSLGYFVPLRTYKHSEISRITLHRRGYEIKGILVGIGAGVILGFVQGDGFFSAGENAAIIGLLFAPLGVVGSLFSLKSVDARNQSVATEMQGRLRKFAIVEQLKKANVYAP